jgi:hypothetical protein
VSQLAAPPLIFIGVNEAVPGRQTRQGIQNRLLDFSRGCHVEARGEGG